MPTLKTSWDDHYMYPAFIGCVRWALGEPEIMDAYRRETGDNWMPPAILIDKLIDEAAGADFAFCQRFSDWVEENVFGTPQALGLENSVTTGRE